MQNFPMFNNKMTASEKYAQYVLLHPKCKKMSRSAVVNLMFANKIINSQELFELQNPLFTKKNNSEQDYGYKAMGLELTDSTTTKANGFTNLKMINKNSKKVDMNYYTLEGLKAAYDSKKYDIKQDKYGNITVSLKNGTHVLDISDHPTERGKKVTYYDNGQIQCYYVPEKTGEVDTYELLRIENDTRNLETYNGDGVLLSRYNEFKNGDVKLTRYNEKGEITQVYLDNCSSTSLLFFSDGKPYKKQNDYIDENPQYILVDDLIADIYAKNKIGLPTTRSSISENVLKRINKDNIIETLRVYKEKTGNTLIQDIKDEIGLSPKLKDKFVNHIISLYVQESPDEGGKKLARMLFDDIDGLGSGDLAKHVKLINSDNLKYVLSEYRRLSFSENIRAKNNVIEVLDFLNSIPSVHFDYNTSQKVARKLAPIEGLLKAIYNEWGLSANVRNNLIKQIIDIALEDTEDEVKNRTKKDITSHPDDYHKVEIDLYRARNNQNNSDGRTLEEKISDRAKNSANKTFSGQIKQGLTGDCWLLAGLNSVIAKPKFLNELEKKVRFDSKTGDYFVALKVFDDSSRAYKDKIFKVTKDDMNSYTKLSTGSEKINAVEIAMDKLIRDYAYENESGRFAIDKEFNNVNDVTIDGNHSKFLWNSLFGENYNLSKLGVDPKIENFNNSSRVYSVSFGGTSQETFSGLASSEKDKNCDLFSRHAYSIIGSDEKNIYLLNPWDSSDKITISREDFKKVPYNIEFFEFNNA